MRMTMMMGTDTRSWCRPSPHTRQHVLLRTTEAEKVVVGGGGEVAQETAFQVREVREVGPVIAPAVLLPPSKRV